MNRHGALGDRKPQTEAKTVRRNAEGHEQG